MKRSLTADEFLDGAAATAESIMANSNWSLRRSEAAAISYPDFWSDLKRLQQKN